jgi:hypothetical protein
LVIRHFRAFIIIITILRLHDSRVKSKQPIIPSINRLFKPLGSCSSLPRSSQLRLPPRVRSARPIFTATPMSPQDTTRSNAHASSSTSTFSPICDKFPELKGLMEGNRSWAKQCGEEMPELLPKLATGQVSLDLSALCRKAGHYAMRQTHACQPT